MGKMRGGWKRSRLPEYLTQKEIEEFLQIAYAYNVMHGMAYEFMWQTGVRSFELEKIRREDIDFEGRILRINEGKGGKDRLIPMSKTYVQKLVKYMEERSIKDQHQRIFPFPTRSQRHWCIKYRKMTSYPHKNLPHPHTFRHSFARFFLERAETKHINDGLVALQQIMGHEDISTTSIYLSLLTRKIQEIYDNVFT